MIFMGYQGTFLNSWRAPPCWPLLGLADFSVEVIHDVLRKAGNCTEIVTCSVDVSEIS